MFTCSSQSNEPNDMEFSSNIYKCISKQIRLKTEINERFSVNRIQVQHDQQLKSTVTRIVACRNAILLSSVWQPKQEDR